MGHHLVVLSLVHILQHLVLKMHHDTGHEVDLGLSARITEACTDGCLLNWGWLLSVDILLDLAIPLGLQSLQQLLDLFPRELHDFMPDLALGS